MTINRDTADWGQFQPQRRNIVINGDSRIWQRGTSFTAHTTGFFADRFTWVQAGTPGIVTASRDPATPAGVGRNGHAMKIAVTTADTSIAAGEVYGIRYPIEANDMEHLNIGSTDAKTVTLSFRVASSKAGIHSGSLRNEVANRAYVFEYTVDAVATWQTITVTIDLDTTGTWSVDNNVGMDLFFSLATGTNFQGTVGAWTAGNFVGSSNQVNVMDTASNNFWLTNVQLEVGTEATDFEYRSIGEELALCQRYFNKSYATDIDPGTNTNAGAWTFMATAVNTIVTVPYQVEMRTTPATINFYSATGTSGKWTGSLTGEFTPTLLTGRSANGRATIQNNPITAGEIVDGHWTADAEL